MDDLITAAQTAQGQAKEPPVPERSVSKNGGKKKAAALSSVDEESLVERETARRNNLLKEQANPQRAMMGGPQSSQLIILPKFCDKKNGRLAVTSAQENQYVCQDHHFQPKQLGLAVLHFEADLPVGPGHLRVHLLQRGNEVELEEESLRLDQRTIRFRYRRKACQAYKLQERVLLQTESGYQ